MFQGLGETFSFNLFIFGPKYFAKKKYVITLLNFLSGSAKLATWLTRRNRTQNSGSTNAMMVFQGILKARLTVEHTFYMMMENMQDFPRVWAVGEVLCSVGRDEELIIKF